MEYNIFYLIGSGASVDNFRFSTLPKKVRKNKVGLPLANNFYECMEQNIFSNLKESKDSINLVADIIKKTIVVRTNFPENLEAKDILPYETLIHLYSRIKEYGTVDETVRAFYLNDHNKDVLDFKKAISLLFYVLENVLVYRDYRYIQFILTIIRKDKTLPDNIHFLSWNYDNQFEHSVNDLFQNDKPDLINKKHYYKINGTSDFFPMQKRELNSIASLRSRTFLQGDDNINFNKKNIESIHKSATSNILFAWENDVKIDVIKAIEIMLTKEKSKSGNILVCIGYSFPFVNELFDKQIIKKLNPHKIYFQNPNSNEVFLEQIRERIKLYNPKYPDNSFFKHINDVSSFYIPNELTNSDSLGKYILK